MKVTLDQYGRILIKFLFTNPKHIPAGIPEQKVGSNEERDLNHLIEAATQCWIEKAEVGRVREGRVDTGENFIPGLNSVSIGEGFAQLIGGGWNRIANPHWFCQQPKTQPGQKPRQLKYVVVLNLMRIDGARVLAPNTPKEALGGLNYLINDCNWTLHGWTNPNGVITLNNMMIQEGPGQRGLVFNEETNELGIDEA